jgi:regulator of sigma E protease
MALLSVGASLTLFLLAQTVVGIAQLIGGAFTGTASLRSITGPVGIAHLVGDAAKLGASYVLMFAAIISINLGVVNLLPLPALDGGRIVIVSLVYSKILRQRIS